MVFRDYLWVRRMAQPRFANGAQCAQRDGGVPGCGTRNRLAGDLERGWTRDDLMRIEPADILADPVFATSADPLPESNRT